jgi:hypothetical protein
MAASGTARFLMPRASNYNGHPLQKLQTLNYHIYLLNFHLLATVIENLLSTEEHNHSFFLSFLLFSFHFFPPTPLAPPLLHP